jgi:transcriptional regulator with GAF, ATPase, and Fis domain
MSIYSENLAGKSKAILQTKAFVEEVAGSDQPVLLLGKTGVGKELVARLIHERSGRKKEKFVPINVANIPENLLESEFFGCKKGAFTDAKEDRAGLLEKAGRGTVFLDEIAECSPYLQAKLLRVVETGEIKRLGDDNIRKVAARFIFSTNRELEEEMDAGRFRKDLYYRIGAYELWILPLRERKKDIPLLANHILGKIKKGGKKISQGALNKLLSYDFPGDIRELEHIIKRAYFRCRGNEIQEGDIIIKPEKKDADINISERLYQEMRQGGKNFWEAVHEPFLRRDLKRSEVKEILAMGLRESQGSYKRLLPLFNLRPNEKEYQRLMKVIRVHKLFPEELPYRANK